MSRFIRPAPYERALWSRALEKSLIEGSLPQARAILHEGPEPSWRPEDLSVALVIAARAHWPEAIELLLGHGASVSLSAWRAGAQGGPRSVLALAKAPGALAALAAQNSSEDLSPLAIACAGAHTRSVRLFLRWGADPRAKDPAGREPLHHAALCANLHIAALLLAAGADPRASDHEGCQPAHAAAHANSVGLLRLLARAGADLDAASHRGATPLWRACSGHAGAAIAHLVARGARLELSPSPRSPLAFARANGMDRWSALFERALARRERRALAQAAPAAPASPRARAPL